MKSKSNICKICSLSGYRVVAFTVVRHLATFGVLASNNIVSSSWFGCRIDTVQTKTIVPARVVPTPTILIHGKRPNGTNNTETVM